MIVISDTSPIRGLLSIGKIDLLKDLFEKVYIPISVRDELLRIKAIHSDIHALFYEPWFEIKEIQNKEKLGEIKIYLDSGESEAIILAKEMNCTLILMDENKGRKIAKSLGMDVLGLIGILILAREKQLISEIKPFLNDLREKYGFWINQDFYTKVLKSLKED